MTADRPVLVDRFLEDADRGRRRRGARRHRRGGDLRGDGARRGGRGALGRLGLRPPAPDAVPTRSVAELERHTAAIAEALEVRGLCNVQFAVKDGRGLRASRPTRGPAGPCPFVAKATGVPAGHGGRPGRWWARPWPSCGPRACSARAGGRGPRERQGGGAALQPVPRGRHPARPRDALDRRGDGHRRHLRPGLRQEPDRRRQPAARRRARSSSRWPTGTRRPASRRPGGSPRSASSWPPPRARPPSSGRGHRRGDGGGQGVGRPRRGRRTVDAVELIAGGQGPAGREHAPRAGAHGPTAPTSGPPRRPTWCRASPRWPRPGPRPPASPTGARVSALSVDEPAGAPRGHRGERCAARSVDLDDVGRLGRPARTR